MKTNQFELSGFVGNPPDARFTPNGKTVVTFSLYTKERWSDGSGAAREVWGEDAQPQYKTMPMMTEIVLASLAAPEEACIDESLATRSALAD